MTYDACTKPKNWAITLVSLALSIAGIVVGDHAIAQEPQQPQQPGEFSLDRPIWTSSATKQTMALWPPDANVGVGVAQPVAPLHVVGSEIEQAPGAGYLVLGAESTLHMQLDRNEIRVAGPTADTVGTLYLQRFGGQISVRSSRDMAQRVVFPAEGGLAIGTTDPHTFAIDEGFRLEEWERPNAALAVDGHIYTHFVFGSEGRFSSRLRVGPRSDKAEAWGPMDKAHDNAVAMIGGKLTAHEIIVHIDHWADDVFADDYELRSLESTKTFIEANHHLPDVPSEADVRAKGADLAEMNAVLLRKVEELTLHAIAQQDRIDALEAKFDARD